MSCLNPYIEISAGESHALILSQNGRVSGFGDNTHGQIDIPTDIQGNVSKIFAADVHSLAILKDGRVTGWGYNNSGQINIPVGIGNNATGIAGGENHSFALLKNGSITGWGSNQFNQINFPSQTSNIVQIGAGEYNSFALFNNGRLSGWGDNGNGALNIPTGIQGNIANLWEGSSRNNFFVILTDGRVTGWGDNPLGELNAPSILQYNTNKIAISLHGNLALLKDGTVTGWGYNNNNRFNIPTNIQGNVTGIALGYFYSFAILKNGNVTGTNNFELPSSKCFQNITFPTISGKSFADPVFFLSGSSDSNLPLTYISNNATVATISGVSGVKINDIGSVTITASQAGNSNFEPAIPVSQSFNVVCDNIKEVSAGFNHTLAILKDGRVTGWGSNEFGQTTIPVGIGTGAASISAGLYHSLTVLKDGRVSGWGYNNSGQIDIPTGIGTGAAQVSAGDDHSLALLKNGMVTGWGNNEYGKIDIPAGIGTGAAQISAGTLHSLALLKDGRVTGWGRNLYGETTIPFGIGTGAAQIGAGFEYSLALLKDGRVTGWGRNFFGETNVPVGIGTGAASISVGYNYALALLKDGRITGWGNNFYGQTIIPVGIGSGAASINAGAYSSFALLKDGRVTGWGRNDVGQLNVPRILGCLPLNSSRVISAPTSTYILSGQSLSNAPLIGGSGDVPGTFSWTDSSFIPPNIGRFSYSVTFVPSDIGSYTTSSTGSFVNVLGIPNIITKPTGTSIKYGQTLVNSNLTDGVADTSGTFNWTNPQNIANNNTGINNYPVTFVPNSEYYINALTDANVNVTKGDQIINFPNITNKILGASFVLNATSNIGSTINYSTNDTDLISLDNVNNNTIVISNSLGSPTITANASGNQFYDAAPSVSRTFNIIELPFISKNDLNLNLNFGNLTNNLNFDIELSGSPLVTKSFDIDNNEPFYIGLQKDHAYAINVKSREKLFEFGNLTGTKVISSNSYINTANLNIDFSENEPQLDISTEVNDFLSLVYRLDNIITPSGIESVNENQLKAFTIDYKTYITGEVLDIQQIPYLNYKKYELENYCPPKQVVIEAVPIDEDPCSVDFACAICSSALKIRSNNPSQTFIDIPQARMPFRIYGKLVDYIFTNTNPGFYRIALNDKLFSLCCQCKEDVECTKALGGDGGGGGGGDTAFTECKQDNLFDRPKNVNENSLNQKYGLYFLDAITLKSISTNYGPNSYYSGEIKNANSFSEGDKIGFKQYSYNFEQAYADIYLNNPAYKPVDADFIYSSTITGDKYFYTTSQLVDKINLIYNSTGIYTWLPMLYSKKPYYNYGPMLFAELKDESTVGLTSLKSGRLGEHIISLISAPRPNAIINSYLVPKTIELQGSDDGLIWNKIISSKDVQPVNVLSTSYTKVGGNINYEAVDNTKVTREITVPISSTTGNRIVPSGTAATSGELSNLIDQIESGNKQFATGNGATIVCIPTAGKVSNICGSGYIELWIPSGCPIPDLEPKESGVKEDNEDGDKSQEGTDEKTILIEESVFRLGFTDYR